MKTTEAGRHYAITSYRVPMQPRVGGCACGMRGGEVETAAHLSQAGGAR